MTERDTRNGLGEARRAPIADYGRLTAMQSREDDAHRSADSGYPYDRTRSIGLASADDVITDRYHVLWLSSYVPLRC